MDIDLRKWTTFQVQASKQLAQLLLQPLTVSLCLSNSLCLAHSLALSIQAIQAYAYNGGQGQASCLRRGTAVEVASAEGRPLRGMAVSV